MKSPSAASGNIFSFLPLLLLPLCCCSHQEAPKPAPSVAVQGTVTRPQPQATQAPASSPCPPLEVHAGHDTRALAFSRDGQWLASGGYDKTIIVWNALTGKLERKWDIDHPVLHVVFSPDGGHLASLNQKGKIEVWDFRKGTLLYAASGGVLTYSPDGKIWATSGYRPLPKSERDQSGRTGNITIETHDAATGKLLRTIETGGWAVISTFTITPAGLVFAAGCAEGSEVCEGSAASWDLASGKLVKSYPLGGTVFSSDGHWLANIDGSKLSVFDLSSGKEKESFDLRDSRTQAFAAFSPDGRQVAWAQDVKIKPADPQYESTIDVRSVATGEEIKTLRGAWDGTVDRKDVRIVPNTSPSGFGPMAFSPDGKRLAAANYSFEAQRAITCNSAHTATTTWYRLIKIWDLTTSRELLTLEDQTPQ